MARPTKLTSELAKKAQHYLDVEIQLGGKYFGDLPTVAGLAIYLDVARDTIYAWAKLDTPLGKQFSDTVERLTEIQEWKLIGKSLKNEYNPSISKLLLSSNHGYAESSKIDHTTGGKKIALVEFVGHESPDGQDTSTG